MARPICAVAVMLSVMLCITLLAPAPARAEEQLIYWPLVTNGTEYRRVPYPRQAGSLLVLADTEVVIEARYAPVSYWPITREYLADFSQKPRLAEGSVEIVDESGKVTVVEPEPYVLWYPVGVGAGPSALVRGSEAVELYQDYVKEARSAAAAAQEYQRIVAERQAAAAAWLRMAAERPENLPSPPPELTLAEPEPFQAFATEPREAAVISLPEGAYTVRIRDAGNQIVPGSERDLVSFGAMDQAVGYVLRPADRWTRPMFSFAPDESIYTTGRTDLFFQPVPVVQYEARRFTRLFRPQSVEATDPTLTMWVPREESGALADGAALALWHGDSLAATLPRTPYRVAQLAGVSRGYTIEEFAPKSGGFLKPDFYAMRVGGDSAATRVSLLLGASGKPARGSERQIRRVSLPAEPLLFLPALLPLAVGVLLRLWARGAQTRDRRAKKVS